MWLDIFFSISFVLELMIKLHMLGFRGQFCGQGSAANIFDVCLIFADILQLVVRRLLWDQVGTQLKDTPSASMFRVVRLVRLVRLLRVLRLPVFADLIAMITGLIRGAPTLM